MTALRPRIRELPAPGRTHGSVHLRAPADLRSVLATWGLALVPCTLVGLHNTGLQAALGHARAGASSATTTRIDLLRAVGLAPDGTDLFTCLVHGALYLVPALAVALCVGGLWEWVFTRVRRRERVPGAGVCAWLFVLLLHPATPLWQVAVGMSFGTVFAREMFGGMGRGFVSAPAAGAVFLALAWPRTLVGDAVWAGLRGHAGPSIFGDLAVSGPEALAQAGVTWMDAFLGDLPGRLGTTSTAACLLGGAYLVLRGTASWHVMLGAACGVLVAGGLCSLGTFALGPAAAVGLHWHVVLGSLAFGAIFLSTDPATAPLTRLGGWFTGAVMGGMVVFVRVANPLHPDGVLAAVVFGNVLAPILDTGAVWLHALRRRRRHG